MSPDETREALGPVFEALFGRFAGFQPIQTATIPIVLAGKGVLVVAPTASGKTEAVLAPLFRLALDRPSARPFALWLCPTRALVNDMSRRIEAVARRLGTRVAVRTGERKTVVHRDTALLITTPESLDVMLSSRSDSQQLNDIEFVVIDEAHLVYGTPRGTQLLMLLRRLELLHGQPVQRAALSATISDPTTVATWLAGDREALQVTRSGGHREVAITTFGGYPDAMARVNELIRVGLRERGWRKILVFTNTRNEADHLAEKLTESLPFYPVELHFSSLSRDHRERVERRLKDGDRGICVATSTLEIGIDIGDIDATYMYGAPGSISSFLQRAGRSNRRSATINVLAIPRTHDGKGRLRPDLWTRDILTFAAIDRAVQFGELESPHAPHFWSVLVQQTFSLARYFHRVGVKPLLEASSVGSAPFATEEGCHRVLDRLSELGYLAYHSYGDYYELTDRGWTWLDSLQIWANFADQSESVPVLQDGDILDQIAAMNRFFLTPGTLVRVKGRTREVVSVDADGIRVGDPSRAGTPMPLKRLGQAWPVSFEIAQSMKALAGTSGLAEVLDHMEPSVRTWVADWFGRFQDVDLESQLAYELGREPSYRTFLGGLGNLVLAEVMKRDGTPSSPDDLGITGTPPSAFTSPRLASCLETIQSAAGALAPNVPTSIHYTMLDADLQRDEIASVVSQPELIRQIERLPDMPLVEIAPPPLIPW